MAILECYFAGFKEEIIDRACNRILEQEHYKDIISRQKACDALRKYKSVVSEPDAYDKAFDDGIDTAIAEIEHNIPPVIPQPKTETLDKIRAEIEELSIYYDNDCYYGNKDAMFKCKEVLKIIDKCRTESEEYE